MHVFRLMAMPDKVIAFDELPKRLLDGFEMCRADGFPRYWKDWMGKQIKITKVPPEKDGLTGQVRKFEPIIEEDYFFYLVDWRVNPVVEKWREVCDFVRTHVDKETRLKEDLAAMALPLASNKTDGVTLEPEDVVVIPIPLQYQEKDGLTDEDGNPVKMVKKAPEPFTVKCEEEGCKASFEGSYARNALRMHTQKKHPSKERIAV